MAQIQELRRRIKSTRGWTLRRELHGLARSYRLFLGNARELEGFLRAHSEPPEAVLELWREDRRAEFERFLDEVDRLLHNFVAAAATLADHTRNVWKDHQPADASVREEYVSRTKETFVAPLPQFVKGLRNYTLHRRLPIAQGQLSWERGMAAPLSRIAIVRDDLLKWRKWTAGAREFLAAAPAEIDIAELVERYTRTVVEFNDWLGEAFVGAHLDAFDELTQLEEASGSFITTLRAGLRVPATTLADAVRRRLASLRAADPSRR